MRFTPDVHFLVLKFYFSLLNIYFTVVKSYFLASILIVAVEGNIPLLFYSFLQSV